MPLIKNWRNWYMNDLQMEPKTFALVHTEDFPPQGCWLAGGLRTEWCSYTFPTAIALILSEPRFNLVASHTGSPKMKPYKNWGFIKTLTRSHCSGKNCHTVSFIHSIGMCRMRRFLAVLRSFFHSSLLCTFSCHPSPPTILPSSHTSSCHLFLGLPLNLVVPKFIYNTLLGILFPSILCTCPNQCNLLNLIVSINAGFLTLA